MRKMSSIISCIITALLLSQCSTVKSVSQEKNDGWISMFNGKDINDWTTKIHHYEVGDNYGDTFRVEDSIIKVRYDKYEGEFNERYGHLYYNTPYSYYHLVIEYRFVGELHPGAPSYTIKNSGVMFHSQGAGLAHFCGNAIFGGIGRRKIPAHRKYVFPGNRCCIRRQN